LPEKPVAPIKNVILLTLDKELELNGYDSNDKKNAADQITGKEKTDILEKLDEFKELNVNTQLTDKIWLCYCKFFKIYLTDNRFKPYLISGMLKSLYSYQVHVIGWILRTVRGIAGGCWMTDEISFGKVSLVSSESSMAYLPILN
jgi:hypothetical protein